MNKVKRYENDYGAIMGSDDGEWVTYEDYAALEKKLTYMAVQLANAESKCRELAAENTGLKAFGDKLYSMYKGLETSGGGFHDEQSIPYQQAALDEAMSAFEEIKTPATDAFLAEVRAQGVEALVLRRKTAARIARERDDLRAADALEGEACRAQMFADEIRQGGAA